ncbi:hypothetical protein HK104_008504 [Borealophlyctis nickersoniae]|nr:hypothetical protein HK104_008504 [Borealophlyctis nickersoniae]
MSPGGKLRHMEALEAVYHDDFSSSPSATAAEGGDNIFPKWIDGVDTTFAPYLPTSIRRVRKCLQMAETGPGDVVLDLGSGDGRFCSVAVKEFAVSRAIGIETEPDLVESSVSLARRVLPAPLAGRCEFICGDIRSESLSTLVNSTDITVLVIFMSPEFAREWEQVLQAHYDRGARIVSGIFDMSDLKGLRLKCKDDGDGIYVYEKPKESL